MSIKNKRTEPCQVKLNELNHVSIKTNEQNQVSSKNKRIDVKQKLTNRTRCLVKIQELNQISS